MKVFEVVVECEIVEAFEVEAENEEQAKHIAECKASSNWAEVSRAKALDAYVIGDDNNA